MVVECLDAVDFIKNYDTTGTFFYLDPIYLHKDQNYAQKFGGADRHVRLRDALAGVKGKWLFSHHDDPTIRELYRGFNIRTLTVPYTVHSKGRTAVKELLISNY